MSIFDILIGEEMLEETTGIRRRSLKSLKPSIIFKFSYEEDMILFLARCSVMQSKGGPVTKGETRVQIKDYLDRGDFYRKLIQKYEELNK